MMGMLDTIIIGAGPAGMTAAIYAKRKGMSLALVSDSIGGNMSYSGNIENYPGFEAISGLDLTRKMRAQMERLNIEPAVDRVIGVERTVGGYRVSTKGGRTFEAHTVIIASGSHWREIGVPGEKEYVSKGVSYCTTCDAPLFAGMDVVVVGGGNAAAEAVMELARICPKVYMIVRSRLKCDQVLAVRITGTGKVTVLEGYTVERISGKDFVESITVRSREGKVETLPAGGVFVEIGQEANTEFLKGLVKTNDRGEIMVDDYCRTSLDGVFACGDVTSVPQKQVVVAAGEGAKAAMSAFAYVSDVKEGEAPSCTL
ncbi:MAG: Sulfide dehydrogenase subunit alpha precursor [Methanocella sp. PtaU1.Bin125]|nr:MAG: Sulfide dehydrogenase subunit alpha precursor [Methanocella sp. PtaU1.Bin125]